MKRPYSIGWFRDPIAPEVVVQVTRIGATTWFVTPYSSKGDYKPCGAGQVLTPALWKRLEQI